MLYILLSLSFPLVKKFFIYINQLGLFVLEAADNLACARQCHKVNLNATQVRNIRNVSYFFGTGLSGEEPMFSFFNLDLVLLLVLAERAGPAAFHSTSLVEAL